MIPLGLAGGMIVKTLTQAVKHDEQNTEINVDGDF